MPPTSVDTLLAPANKQAGAYRGRVMDQLQHKRVNEAAEKFADAVRESYREANAELAEIFFSSMIDNLRAQSERTQEVAERLAEQQRRQQEVAQELVSESINTYFDFLNSTFSYYQRGLRLDQDGVASPQDKAKEAIQLLEEWEADESNYDEETLPEIKKALNENRSLERKLFVG